MLEPQIVGFVLVFDMILTTDLPLVFCTFVGCGNIVILIPGLSLEVSHNVEKLLGSLVLNLLDGR
jgi:hypothetical protein